MIVKSSPQQTDVHSGEDDDDDAVDEEENDEQSEATEEDVEETEGSSELLGAGRGVGREMSCRQELSSLNRAMDLEMPQLPYTEVPHAYRSFLAVR